MESGKYYVISAGNNLTESMTKEQILSAITQAIETGTISDVDTGFVEKIKEQNSAANLKFWVGSTAQYNALETKEQGCFYLLTDDTTYEDIESNISDLQTDVTNLQTDLSETQEDVSDLKNHNNHKGFFSSDPAIAESTLFDLNHTDEIGRYNLFLAWISPTADVNTVIRVLLIRSIDDCLIGSAHIASSGSYARYNGDFYVEIHYNSVTGKGDLRNATKTYNGTTEHWYLFSLDGIV